jgi:hypothetical protein
MPDDPMDLDSPATKRDLALLHQETKADLARLRDELREEMATKADLAQLRDELREEMATKADLRELETRLGQDLARHVNAGNEALRADLITMLEPYKDLPARVTALETAKPKRRRGA